jgi:hypothetical protein
VTAKHTHGCGKRRAAGATLLPAVVQAMAFCGLREKVKLKRAATRIGDRFLSAHCTSNTLAVRAY